MEIIKEKNIVTNPSVEYLKCGTCNVQFGNNEVHREHFKSEWHLYNIKRKVIKMTPITIDQFLEIKKKLETRNCGNVQCLECR